MTEQPQIATAKQSIRRMLARELATAVTCEMAPRQFFIGGDCPFVADVEFGNGMTAKGQPAKSVLVKFRDGDRWLLGGNGSMRWRQI